MPDGSGPSLSRRAVSLKPSATFAVAAKCRELKRRGVDVLMMSLGEPDFGTPEPIVRAAVDALNAGQTHYVPTLGDTETRTVVAEKFTRENGLTGITAEHVSISVGAKHSLYLVCQCLLDEAATERRKDGQTKQADEVLLPVPSWVSYSPIAQLAGGRVVELPTTAETGFKITPGQLRAAITPRSRMLILNTPSNPCGTMYSEAELRALAAIVADAASNIAPELVLVVDEIYEKIVFGDARHFSIGSIPEVAQRTVTINGMSKAFAMTGWRVGFAAAPGPFGLALTRAIDAMQGQMTSCLPAFVYPAVRVALRQCGAQVETMRQEFARRAAHIQKRAAAIPGLTFARPTGAFYLFPDVSAYFGRRASNGSAIKSALDFSDELLSQAHVAVVPGEEFGGCGGNHIRLSFACSEKQIDEGMDRIAKFVGSLK